MFETGEFERPKFDCSCRGGGKLSRPVYLAPNPPEYQSKNILLILLFFKLSECDEVTFINNNKSNSADSLSHCSICLVAGVGASCLGQFILTPTHLGINEKLFY